MIDPHNTMRDYFDNLVHRYQWMESLLKQNRILRQWQVSPYTEALHLGWHFYTLVSFSFSRTVLVEICNFVSKKEDRSLVDWLVKASEHARAINPTRHNPNNRTGERETVPVAEYRSIVSGQLAQIEALSATTDRLKVERDKAIAHADSSVFDDLEKHYKEYPLNEEDLSEVLSTFKTILISQYSLIHGISSSLDVMSLNDVNSVLSKSYAYWLARRDSGLHDKGIYLNKYIAKVPID